MRGQIQVSLKLKHEVIMEPELTAGDVLWNLIKARQEERVIRTMGRNTPWGAGHGARGVGRGAPSELRRASQHKVAERGQEPVYPCRRHMGQRFQSCLSH